MLHPVSLKIYPACLNFLNHYKRPLSKQQLDFYNTIHGIYRTLNQLKTKTFFEFTKEQQQEISRGGFYSLTNSLEEKYLQQEKLNLEVIQTTLKNEFHIEDEQSINFIIACLIEPVWLPFYLSTLAYYLLGSDYICINNSIEAKLEYNLKARTDPTLTDTIIFGMKLAIKQVTNSQEIGFTQIQFTIDKQKQVQLLPIEIQLNFQQQEAKQFQQQIMYSFHDWISLQKELDNILLRKTMRWHTTKDLCIIPLLFGLFLGLIGMISLLILSATPISPLLLPLFGLALGFLVASICNIFSYTSTKQQEKKIHRPIVVSQQLASNTLLNLPKQQTTSFFQSSNNQNSKQPMPTPPFSPSPACT